MRSHTRERLLDAAGHLFVELGYLEATIGQIHNHVGVSNGSFFHFFKTKQDIALALIERIDCSFREDVLSRLILPARSPKLAIGALLHAYLRWIGEDGARARLWFGLRPVMCCLGGAGSAPAFSSLVNETVEVWARPLIQSGNIRRLPIDVIAACIFGAPSLVGFPHITSKSDPHDWTAGAQDMASMAWDGIKTKNQPHRSDEETRGDLLDL